MNIDVKKAKKLMDDFHSQVVPWCEECQLSLHNAFEISRNGTTNDDTMRYRILSELWQTKFGKAYLQSYFRSRGGTLRIKKDENE